MTELQQVERLVNLTVGKLLAFGIFILMLGARFLFYMVGRWWGWLRGRSVTAIDPS
jgi:hypothetical protein